jgi:glycerol uptake facilitator-like aquaporin
MEKYITEFVGTSILVYVILITKSPLAIGITLTAIILASNKSSGHFNPAVTIALSFAGMIQKREVLPFCLSQIFGGIMGIQLYILTKK